MGTAQFIKAINGWQGDARLYELSEPLVQTDRHNNKFDYVIVSASVVPYSGPETYIFGANEDGEVANWFELDGSYRGGLDHTEALRQAGYDIATPQPSS